MSMENPVATLNKILKDTFGTEINGSIARSPAWGHADNCWIIRGRNARKAAYLLAAKFNATVTMSRGGFCGVSYAVEF